MKIEQLLQREPFGDIIEKTLSKFLSEHFGAPHQVKWKSSGIMSMFASNSASADSDIFFCNPYLNIIYPEYAGSLVFKFIRDNYLQTPFRHRRLMQKTYVTLATSRPTARFFTTHKLEILPRLPESANLVILGGNNRIRLIDLVRMRSWDILKSGFDPEYMAAELKARRATGEWPFPRLYATGEDGAWFESEHVPAVSINRLASGADDLAPLTQAFRLLGKWLDQSRTSSLVSEYADGITAKLHSLCNRKDFNNSNCSATVRVFLDQATLLLQLFRKDVSLTIDLADGHGDFQPGNILVDKTEKIWIVDWEHAEQRQLAYDYLVFGLRSRFPTGLSGRIQEALFDPETVLSKLPAVHERFRLSIKDAKIRPVILLIFLCEELLWNIRENSNPLFFKSSGALPIMLEETIPSLQAIRSYLEKKI